MFSGGSYEEVRRWLRMFINSHAKRENPRVEVVLDEDEALEGRAYRARLHFDERVGEAMEFDFREVADHRGELAWCAALAARTRAQARSLIAAGGTANARAR